MDIWEKLYEVAKKQYNPHDLSPFFYSNHVACAIEAKDGQIFAGFCIEGASGVLNLCAERIAAINMIVNSSQTEIKKILSKRVWLKSGGFLVIEPTEALIALVDEIGGVEFNVPIDMDYDDSSQDLHIHLKAGQQLLNGENVYDGVQEDLDLIKIADYVIDLGPEGGDFGGEVIACGTPEEVSKNPKSYTGQYLKSYL